MNTDKIHLLRSFIESLDANDNIFKQSVLEALDTLIETKPVFESEEYATSAGTQSTALESVDVLDIGWETLLDGLKALVADSNAGNMQIILQNNSGGHYLFFKQNDKIEFVTNVSNAPDVEELETGEPEKSKFLGRAAY